MPATTPTTRPGRKRHRLTCVAAGGLALLGGALGLFVSPWFLSLAVTGGMWLIGSGLWAGLAETANAAPPPTPADPVT